MNVITEPVLPLTAEPLPSWNDGESNVMFLLDCKVVPASIVTFVGAAMDQLALSVTIGAPLKFNVAVPVPAALPITKLAPGLFRIKLLLLAPTFTKVEVLPPAPPAPARTGVEIDNEPLTTLILSPAANVTPLPPLITARLLAPGLSEPVPAIVTALELTTLMLASATADSVDCNVPLFVNMPLLTFTVMLLLVATVTPTLTVVFPVVLVVVTGEPFRCSVDDPEPPDWANMRLCPDGAVMLIAPTVACNVAEPPVGV